MSGLEVGALVVSIMALFPPLQALWNDWKATCRAKKSAEVEKVDQSLTVSLPVIGSEYDSHIRALGKQFIVGDETAQLALSQIRLAQQENLIAVLRHALLSNGGTQAETLHLPSLHSSSESIRRNTIGAMSDLHQRLAVQQGPGRKLPPPPPYEDVCKEDSTEPCDSSDEDDGCNFRGIPNMSPRRRIWTGELDQDQVSRCMIRIEREVPGSLGYRIGDVYLTWGNVLMLAHLVCECYGSLSKGQSRFACIFCHCPKKTLFQSKEVWCQKGLHYHMSKEHRDRLW